MADKAVVEAVRVLNDALERDPKAVRELFKHRVPVNNTLAEHPTIQVRNDSTMSVLGLLNGLFGCAPDGWGFIAAMVGDNGEIHHFEVRKLGDEPGKPIEFAALEIPPPPPPVRVWVTDCDCGMSCSACMETGRWVEKKP